MTSDPTPDWHTLRADELFRHFSSSPEGLTQDEVAARLERYGPNRLPAPRAVPPLLRFLSQFNNALIYFLLASAAAAIALRHGVDAAVILLVVLVNAIVGFVQEGRAEQALNSIKSLISPHATVIRDRQRQIIDVADLVPGDIVLIEAGDRVPADMRLLRTRGLAADEAMLTGESVTAEKNDAPVAADAGIGDRTGMAFSGTLVAKGQATGIVVATGLDTEIGRISGLLSTVPTLVTPLLSQINSFTRKLTLFIFGCTVALFLFAVLARGYAWPDALIAIVAVAVGAIPEGLPAVITITLAIGVRRMAARRAVIRKLPAVETLGSTSVICTDKTGTLTRNEMTVRHMIAADRLIAVGGAGYVPIGELTAEDDEDDASALAEAALLIRCGLLCNDARLREETGKWSVAGDPMEGALIALAMKAGLSPDHLRGEWRRLDEIPFDAAYRFMATLHESPEGRPVIFVKGAPEVLLALSASGDGEDRDWEDRVAALAARGERVLGFAMGELREPLARLDFAHIRDLHFLGVMGFLDPPREEAAEAIRQCRSAGIAVKMITGDHRSTALAIAEKLELADHPRAITGAELEHMDDDALPDIVERTSVFARTSPEHKLRIVRALQARGEIVAMTGDGVNDAPSLKQADVGTAMGASGTEAAREASEMVLLDDNFASIVAAVREGRTVYDDIRKVIAWTLPTNGGEGLAIILAILVGFTLPMSATQILWINLITSVSLGLALAFEPAEPGVMRRPPRGRNTPLLSPFLWWRVLFVSVLFAGALLVMFFDALDRGLPLETARTIVVNMLVVAEIVYLFNVRYLHLRSLTWEGARGTSAVLIAVASVTAAQLAFTYIPAMNAIFDSRPLPLAEGVRIVGTGVLLLLVLEAEKYIMRRLGWFDELKG